MTILFRASALSAIMTDGKGKDELSVGAKTYVTKLAKEIMVAARFGADPEMNAKLRKAAMDKNLKMVEVAQRMLDVADLLG